MTIKEIYEYAEKIGNMVFSTIHKDEVQSRIAHFNGWDDEGIYFRTMTTKPYYRQLMEHKKVTVCGLFNNIPETTDEDGMSNFYPGYSFRLVGDVRNLTLDELKLKAETHPKLEMALKDSERYPAMTGGNFVIYKAKVEIFDFDFNMENREHKVYRIRAEYGGMPFNPAGPTITDKCIACGKCFKACTFKAITPGKPYFITPEYCDDCGDCSVVCPVNAIELSKTF